MASTLSMLAAAMSGSSTSAPASISSFAISMLWGTHSHRATTHWSRRGMALRRAGRRQGGILAEQRPEPLQIARLNGFDGRMKLWVHLKFLSWVVVRALSADQTIVPQRTTGSGRARPAHRVGRHAC